MRQYLGFPVLAAGLAFGAYTHGSWLFASDDSTRTQAAVASEADRQANRSVSALVPTSAVDLLDSTPPDPTTAKIKLVMRSKVARDAGEPGGRSIVSTAESTGSWSTEVRSGLGRAEITSAAPADDSARYQLIRDIQSELKRVGCYGGAIDGSWGASSKWALGAFMDRINASLPITEPDYILLSLVKGQPAHTCGSECPSGQSRVGGGRCVPTAILAQAARKGAPASSVAHVGAIDATQTAWSTEVQPSYDSTATLSTGEPLPGRMSVGGPIVIDGETARTAQTSFDAAAPAVEIPAYRRADSGDRAKVQRQKRRGYSTRSVQNIFTHPLGRM